ncbi:MAG: ABC transporter ATP-binding protein, partial [Actinobacteria bacterium]|nr:ABC transporter ATP-binding protein [Actinomycetota bacterium]
GKSTLLGVLVGAVAPSAGLVRRPPAERIGYLPARSGVYPDLTVAENLAFAAAVYRVPRAELRAREQPLLVRTGLGPARGRLGGNLSGGMRQKLALAMALVHDPALLVLDEPTTGIDPVSRSELWRLIASAAAGGAAVVLATSYLDEAERAEHVLVLQEGSPLLEGSPDGLIGEVPGAVVEGRGAEEAPFRWRRGVRWRAWSPGGAVPAGCSRVEPDLQDAVTVAALRAEGQGREAA